MFLAMLDADEGRREPSLGTKTMQINYNGLIFPIARITSNRTKQKI